MSTRVGIDDFTKIKTLGSLTLSPGENKVSFTVREANLKDNAYRIRAQVDVLMPGDRLHMAKRYRSDGTLLPTLGKPDGITRAELQRTAKNVLTLMLRYENYRKSTEET